MSYQDVNWGYGFTEAMPVTNSPILLKAVIAVFEQFGYVLGPEWPQQPILVFRKEGEEPIRIASPDFRAAHGGAPCYDRPMMVDMFERTIIKGDITGGTKLRMALSEQSASPISKPKAQTGRG